MEINKQDLPVLLQAFDVENNTEIFVAEQLVISQAEVDNFTALYAGKIIKAIKEVPKNNNTDTVADTRKRNPATGFVMIVLVLAVLALVIYGFATGFIQDKFNLNI